MRELAISILNYLTGKGGDFTPLDKDEYISSSSNGEEGSVQNFLDELLEQAISDMDKKSEGWVTYDVVYGLEHKGREYTFIINITDYYELRINEREQEDYYDLENRKINSVIIEINGEVHEINLDDLKSQLYDYSALHERIYEAFNTTRWKKIFEWEGIEDFKKWQHKHWSRFIMPTYEKGGDVSSFAHFHEEVREQLKKYLTERKSQEFILNYVAQQLDTAHLYGLNEPKNQRR